MRKRAQQLLAACLGRELPAAFRSALAAAALPVVGSILAATPDSPLHAGEGSEVGCLLCSVLNFAAACQGSVRVSS